MHYTNHLYKSLRPLVTLNLSFMYKVWGILDQYVLKLNLTTINVDPLILHFIKICSVVLAMKRADKEMDI